MKLIPPTGDRNMEQFLKTAAATAQLDLDEGRDLVSARFRNRVTDLSTAFAATYKTLSRALADRRVLVSEREQAVRNLIRVYRAIRNNLKRQGDLGLITPTILGRFHIKSGRQPIPTQMDAWLTLAEKMQTTVAELTAEGEVPVTTPSFEGLTPLLEEAREKTTALNAKHGEIKEIRDRIKRQRAAAQRLHGALMTHIRANLYGEEASSIRDTLRRYGYVYTGDWKASEEMETMQAENRPPGETDCSLPQIKSNPQIIPNPGKSTQDACAPRGLHPLCMQAENRPPGEAKPLGAHASCVHFQTIALE